MRAFVILALGGCQAGAGGEALFDAAPMFELVDMNPSSETFSEEVSPRDARGMISAWYFGHSS